MSKRNHLVPWRMSSLGELATYTNGRAFKKEEWKEKGLPIIRIQNLNDPEAAFNYTDAEHEPRYRVRHGDLLVSWAASLGVHIWQGSDAWVNQHIFRVEPRVEVASKKYLFYALKMVIPELYAKTHGSGMVHVTRGVFDSHPVPLPPREEQDWIVGEIEKQFSRLDEAVANLKRVKANLKRYKAAVLNAAVEGRLVPTEAELARREGRSYETGGQLLEHIRSLRRAISKVRASPTESTSAGDELPPLPPGWAWARLDAIAELKGGITVDKKRNDATAREVPYLRVANVQRGYLDLSEVKTIRASEADISSLALRAGDILFNEGGDRDKLGRGWVWEGQIAECIHQNHVFRARPLLDALSPMFISWWGNTFGKDYFLREGKQTTNLASISLTKLSRFPVPIPPASEQARITAEAARLLSIIDRLESALGVSMVRTSSLKTALLSKAFRSDARIEDDEIKSSATEGEVTMQKRALPQLPSPRASEAEDDRQDLLGVLARFSEGIAVERLLADSGYKGDQVDQFYRDLAKLTKLIEVTVPENPKNTWPFVHPAIVRLRRKG